VCDYNNVKDRFSVDNCGSRITLAQWRAHGYDAHSIVFTPAVLFTNNNDRNYRLSTNSPAIDAGTTVPNVPWDQDGVSRPLDGNNDGQSRWDAGAFEYIHPTADTDGDGFPDAAEWQAGYDPTNAATPPRGGLHLIVR
jgi:hypothetical protein